MTPDFNFKPLLILIAIISVFVVGLTTWAIFGLGSNVIESTEIIKPRLEIDSENGVVDTLYIYQKNE